MSESRCPFFMTHHAPMGAWSSLTFGLPGHGVGVESQALAVDHSAEFYVGVSRGAESMRVLPFFSGGAAVDVEAINLQGKAALTGKWQAIAAEHVTRTLSPGVDRYQAEDIDFAVYTPHPALPDPLTGGDAMAYACCPGILMELSIDNTRSDRDAFAVLGMSWLKDGRLRPLDWSAPGELCGIGIGGQWALAASAEAGQVFTCRDNNIRKAVAEGRQVLHPGGSDGAILMRVGAGERRRLRAVVGFYRNDRVTQGLDGRFLYTRWFADVESVCRFVLKHADQIRRDCTVLDERIQQSGADARRVRLFSQALRSYAVNTQLIEVDGRVLFNVCEGQFGWRNTLDLAADHLPWELWRNPWVVRNIMDLYIDRYSYVDTLKFPGESGFDHPGGLAFCHDQGNYQSYSPPGRSGYEMTNTSHYCHMTTEQVLNGAFCLSGYALIANDPATLERWAQTAWQLVNSIQQRDHYDSSQRDGLVKATSSRCGELGHEITTYDCMDPSLCSTWGNVYIVVKTWCAALMLEAMLNKAGCSEQAAVARACADRTAGALVERFDASAGVFPANLFEPGRSRLIAAVEPLAVPSWCGLDEELGKYDNVLSLLREHVRSCMVEGATLEPTTGGMRLSSASDNSWPSKSFLCCYVIEQVLGIDLDGDYPSVLREIQHWMQVSASAKTVSDQMLVSHRKAHAGSYYPRHITSALWVCRPGS